MSIDKLLQNVRRRIEPDRIEISLTGNGLYVVAIHKGADTAYGQGADIDMRKAVLKAYIEALRRIEREQEEE